ncbi:MAG TPA: hypothetical protein VHG31_01010 [Stellaceae bacterium]|nr:hypothetical protein [Stellaceae bacterium]
MRFVTVQKLPAPHSGSKVYSVRSLPNFAVRVRNAGTKIFSTAPGFERAGLLGSYGARAEKRQRAMALLQGDDGTLSLQVLQEFYAQVTRPAANRVPRHLAAGLVKR